MKSYFKSFFAIVLLPLLLLSPKTSSAWGAKGHGIVAEIAFSYLDDQTKKNVLALLDGMNIEDAANWMDAMRSDHAFDYMKPYHYIDLPKGQELTETNGENIVGVLNQTLHELENPAQLSRDKLKTDLLYLFHLIGDLHQPLHVGYPEDKGGNTYQVSFFGQGTNLHHVWDTDIIEYEKLTLESVLEAEKKNPKQIADIQKIDILQWANDSRSYLNLVYSLDGHTMNENYIRKALPVIESQLYNAGLRLASVLQRYYRNILIPAGGAPAIAASIPTIDIKQASSYEGKTVRICDKVYLSSSNRQPTFLDMGDYYPNSPLTVVIFGESRSNFSNTPEIYYVNKQVCITGKIQIYKGKPEIIADDQKQIELK
jgi:hypothetical protein